MSTKPCPHCGSTVPEKARFCGQCGKTIAEAAPVAPAPAPAPERSGAKFAKTLFDPSPFGANPTEQARDSQRPTSPPEAPVAGEPPTARGNVDQPSFAGLGNDEVTAKRSMPETQPRPAGVGTGLDTQPASQELTTRRPAFAQTIVLGGVGPAVESGQANPATPSQTSPQAPILRPDASPLSRSVLAPSSWAPPPQAAAPTEPPGGIPTVAPSAVPTFAPSAAATEPPGGIPTMAPGASLSGAPAPSPAPAARQAAAQTMLGMPARDLAPAPAPAADLAPAPTAVPAPAPAAQFPSAAKTMLGVAIPGIAPTHDPARGATPPDPNRVGTLLGVAIPGIAPTHERPPSAHVPAATGFGMQPAPQAPLPPIVPPPAPLVDEPLPEAPRRASKRGVPALAVVGIVVALVLVVGAVGAFVALRSSGTLTAQPQLDETGRESLKIACATCPDGTNLILGASSAQVKGGTAVLPLPAPLSIGDNDLAVQIDRPASGRDEEVKVHVPVAYRVRADLATLSSKPPTITVRIEATSGTEVTVEGKPVPLDGTGRATYPIALTDETVGPSDEARVLDRKIAFSITPKGGKLENGTLTARAGIVPLHIDAPGTDLVTDKASAAVAGQTKPGGTVTIDGRAAPVDAQGRFSARTELPSAGEKVVEIVASAPPLAPRTVRAKVSRVTSLDSAAKELDAKTPIGFAVFGPDPNAKKGSDAFVEGEVVEVRASNGYTVLLVEERKACTNDKTTGSCIVRVLYGDELKANRGDPVRVYGRVAGGAPSSGRVIPDIDAVMIIVSTKPGAK